jgi:membrane protein required for beta-lactamase induction
VKIEERVTRMKTWRAFEACANAIQPVDRCSAYLAFGHLFYHMVVILLLLLLVHTNIFPVPASTTPAQAVKLRQVATLYRMAF